MEALLILLMMPLPIAAELLADPASGMWAGKEDVRNMECVRVSQEQGHAQHPGQVPDVPARRTADQEDALLCTRRIMSHGERSARDDQILSDLGRSVGEIADAAAALAGDVTWHVDAFYPEPRVASKIAVAARTSLAESGRRVSDRVPLLAAGDLAVLGRLPPKDAFPLACARYFAEGSLGAGDAFLALMLLDARETQLHAGLCVEGRWRWLR
jgi:hypothetical protein